MLATVTLKITSDESKAVGNVNTVIDALFAGKIDRNAASSLWSLFSMTEAGLGFMNKLYRASNGYLFRTRRKHV